VKEATELVETPWTSNFESEPEHGSDKHSKPKDNWSVGWQEGSEAI
jgi:hypothetical protein